MSVAGEGLTEPLFYFHSHMGMKMQTNPSSPFITIQAKVPTGIPSGRDYLHRFCKGGHSSADEAAVFHPANADSNIIGP